MCSSSRDAGLYCLVPGQLDPTARNVQGPGCHRGAFPGIQGASHRPKLPLLMPQELSEKFCRVHVVTGAVSGTEPYAFASLQDIT